MLQLSRYIGLRNKRILFLHVREKSVKDIINC